MWRRTEGGRTSPRDIATASGGAVRWPGDDSIDRAIMERTPLLASLCMLLACGTGAVHAGTNTDGPPANAGSNAPAPVPPPQPTPEIRRILKAMNHARTWDHPDLFGEFAGLRRLFDGEYEEALKYFRYAARYADKPSQMSIAMMYLNGRGVAKDPVAACAWMTLAAERGVPQQYVLARGRLCGPLSSAQHEQAMDLLDRLRPEYGDEAAKPRMKRALRSAKANMTGSHVGYDFHVEVYAPARVPHCNEPALFIGAVRVPMEGCGAYDPRLWNPEKYFAARDRQPFGTVTVGPLQPVDAPSAEAGQSSGQ